MHLLSQRVFSCWLLLPLVTSFFKSLPRLSKVLLGLLFSLHIPPSSKTHVQQLSIQTQIQDYPNQLKIKKERGQANSYWAVMQSQSLIPILENCSSHQGCLPAQDCGIKSPFPKGLFPFFFTDCLHLVPYFSVDSKLVKPHISCHQCFLSPPLPLALALCSAPTLEYPTHHEKVQDHMCAQTIYTRGIFVFVPWISLAI